MRYLTAGESHGPAITTIIEGLPANLPLDQLEINQDLTRRQQGYGRGGRMKIEKDQVEILAGLRFGKTLGSPLTLQVINKDYAQWSDKMAPFGEQPPEIALVTHPRPGHADLPGALKYNLADIRNVLERASARETVARVAVGAVARSLLRAFDIQIYSYVEAIGQVSAAAQKVAALVAANYAGVENSPVRCPDPTAAQQMTKAIDEAKAAGDSLGGIFVVAALGVPVGLGSHVQWDRKLDARLAAALMSIQAIKGVEIGEGFSLAAQPGSEAHDEIYYHHSKGYYRQTNHAGGIEGGMSNGEAIVCRVAMKPIPTLSKPLQSVNMQDHRPYTAAVERADSCAVPAAAIVGEAVMAWELAQALREKLGSDSLEEMQDNYRTYLKTIAKR
ncbi:MAG TPA: chorismate synthase [Oscillospiraceae bacterium]|nr:chorismate synthase [Oscillospiraceae bacterium]